MNFYQHYMGDYARDTKGLSVMEHGAYRLLMDHWYATEEPIPNDLKSLYRIVGAMTPSERQAVDKVAAKFFPVNGNGLRHHKRIEEELFKAKAKSAKAKESAEARWGKAVELPGGEHPDLLSDMRPHHDGNANQNQKPERSKASPATAGEGRGKTATLPDCPHEKLIDLYHELLPTCTKVVEWNESRKAIMRGRWREQAVPNGKRPGYATEADGLAFWRRYFTYVSQSTFLTGRAEGRDGGAPFVADLEWLVRPKNFAKVVEGKYHR